MTVSRRDFVCRTGAALAGASLAPLAAGCGGMIAYRVTPVSGELRLDLQTITELQVEAGVARLQVEGEEAPLYIVRQNELVYHTLSSVCTHQGCIVEAKRTRFECPCHGSIYTRMGDVQRGPAERALRRYPTTLLPNGRTLVINLRAPMG